MTDKIPVQRQSIFQAEINSDEDLIAALKLDRPFLQEETSAVSITDLHKNDGVDYYTFSASYLVQNNPKKDGYIKTESITVYVENGKVIHYALAVVEG